MYGGTALSALRLGVLVHGVLRSAEWGWFPPAAPDANAAARFDGLRAALAFAALVALFLTERIPTTQPGSAEP